MLRRAGSVAWARPTSMASTTLGTVVSEVVAMMHLLRYSGVDVAAQFNERLIRRMKEKRGIKGYLQEDYE